MQADSLPAEPPRKPDPIKPIVGLNSSCSFSKLRLQNTVKVKQLSNIYPLWICLILMGFPDSSVGKESACNAGGPGSIPGLGRPPGEGIGYLLQYSGFPVVQLVKNPPAV